MDFIKQFAECGKCHLYQGGTCALTQKPVEVKDFCKNYTSHINGCDICGRGILKGAIIYNNHIYCQNCLSLLGTCADCRKGQNCAFNEYQGPLQKIVMMQQRQGNMIMQTQGRNPEVVKITCQNCDCFSNGNCLRETSKWCEKHEELS